MSLSSTAGAEEKKPMELIRQLVKDENDQAQKELHEIELMLEQSQVEVDKLAQRNATITMHLQQVQGQFESLPREDIRVAYDAALDAQQRLVVMRSQVEKLISDKSHLERQLEIINQVQSLLDSGLDGSGNGRSSMANAEMMIQAQETERQRLSRQMHDGPAQALSNFILQTEIAMRLFDMDQDKAKEELGNLKSSASSTFQQVRDFIFDLRPMMLDDLGLVPTVKRYMNAFKEKSSMEVTVNVVGKERRLESYVEVMIFRAIQELLNNTSVHSQATQVKVQLDLQESDVKVVVEDNGKGFETGTIEDLESGIGLKLIRERVSMLNGMFEVDSKIGQGTRVSFVIPTAEKEVFA